MTPDPPSPAPLLASSLLDASSPSSVVAGVPAALASLVEEAAALASRSRGAGTLSAYASAMRFYSAWCAGAGLAPVAGDPLFLALYLTRRSLDGRSVSSAKLARAAVVDAHRAAGVPFDSSDPRLLAVMEGIVRTHGERPLRQAAAAVPKVLRALAASPVPASCPVFASAALAARNRSMMLLGYGAALRRSELAALRVSDVQSSGARGVVVLVRRSKTDQKGAGRRLAVAANVIDPSFCAMRAWEDWMAFRRDASSVGPGGDPSGQALYCAVSSSGRLHGGHLGGRTVSNVVRAAASSAGMDPTRFSGHSLRRGLLTDAGGRQVPIADVMRHSRHKSVETALGYMEEGDLWCNNASDGAFG